jgi:hypothetical protein
MKEVCPRKDALLLRLPAEAGTSGPHPSQNFRLKLELLANLIKRVVRVWPFGFRSELFQTHGKFRK